MCFAAFSPEETYQHLLKAETKDQAQLGKEFIQDLASIKENGYAIRNKVNPSIPGAKAISAPVFDATGNIVACILIIGFKQQDDIQEKDIKAIRDTSKRLSQHLGYTMTKAVK
ncbi:IclR family transcriptional regulator domain-containing protein [Moritella viscosa]